MKPIVLARNDAYETFGVAPHALEEAGAPTVIWEAIEGQPGPALDDVGGIVVFGSSYNVEHADEQPFIHEVAGLARKAVQSGVPFLGVCFGAQLLAWAFDAPVMKSPAREFGFVPIHPSTLAGEDRLLSHYRDGDQVFQWHMDTFGLPEGADLLAHGAQVPHQAYRIGERSWGVQWHLEIDEAEVKLWLDAFEEEGDLQAEWGKDRERVESETAARIQEHERKGAEVFRRFADVVREADG
jgi:GMP synthase (glutamine-hydrolysing)